VKTYYVYQTLKSGNFVIKSFYYEPGPGTASVFYNPLLDEREKLRTWLDRNFEGKYFPYLLISSLSVSRSTLKVLYMCLALVLSTSLQKISWRFRLCRIANF
jgi:hypothetical protein